jgi:lysine-specific demethylase 8
MWGVCARVLSRARRHVELYMPASIGHDANVSCDILNASELGRFRADCYDRNKPCVIRGLAEQKRYKVFEWSAEYFKNVLGNTPVPVIATETGWLSYERDVTAMPYDEFVERSFGSSRSRDVLYYFKNPTKLLPPGHDDSASIEVLGKYVAKALMRNLWISPGGITVGLHYDHAENFNFQLRGEKVFTLYPPGVRAYYPMPMFSQTAHISRVFRDGPNPDLSRYPRFDPSKAVRIDLRAGDVLYLPAYWWHQVESLGDENVNLNFWWLAPAWKQVLWWNQALRGYYQLASRYLKMGSLQKAPAQTSANTRGM